MKDGQNTIIQDESQWCDLLNKLRVMYQYAAASVIHKKYCLKLKLLLKVSRRLQKILQTLLDLQREIVEALIIGLQKNAIPAGGAVKNYYVN